MSERRFGTLVPRAAQTQNGQQVKAYARIKLEEREDENGNPVRVKVIDQQPLTEDMLERMKTNLRERLEETEDLLAQIREMKVAEARAIIGQAAAPVPGGAEGDAQ
jgi:ABC-type phosphate transport system auxiliary subunit